MYKIKIIKGNWKTGKAGGEGQNTEEMKESKNDGEWYWDVDK